MTVIAILQARVTSTRLPRKVLLPIMGVPMLERQIERVLRSSMIDKLVIATSDDPSDDAIENIAVNAGVSCFRGSLNDVLSRFYDAACEHDAKHIVRLTGDCPLADHEVIDEVIRYHLKMNSDYTSNGNPPTFPDGLDVEVIRFTSLKNAWENAKLISEREHVTPYIRERNHIFKVSNFNRSVDLSKYRWTVDEPEDFVFVTEVYNRLYETNPDFLMSDILRVLDLEESLKRINDKFERNEGYAKSLSRDKFL